MSFSKIILFLFLISCKKEITLPDPLAAGWNNESVCELVEENDKLRVLKCAFDPGIGHEKHYHGKGPLHALPPGVGHVPTDLVHLPRRCRLDPGQHFGPSGHGSGRGRTSRQAENDHRLCDQQHSGLARLQRSSSVGNGRVHSAHTIDGRLCHLEKEPRV